MESKANEILGWLQDAVCDCAEGELFPTKNYAKIEKLADKMYNDSGTVQDLIGDRIFDACLPKIYKSAEWKKDALEICNHMIKVGHKAVKIAAENFIKNHNLKEI